MNDHGALRWRRAIAWRSAETARSAVIRSPVAHPTIRFEKASLMQQA